MINRYPKDENNLQNRPGPSNKKENPQTRKRNKRRTRKTQERELGQISTMTKHKLKHILEDFKIDEEKQDNEETNSVVGQYGPNHRTEYKVEIFADAMGNNSQPTRE